MQESKYETWDAEGKSKREIKPYAKGNFFGIYPMMLKRLAMRCKFGEIKYGEARGYMYPRPTSTYFDSAMRHLVEYISGDNSEDHLAAAIWNIMAMMYNEEQAKEFMDIKERKSKNGTYSYFAKKEPVERFDPDARAVLSRRGSEGSRDVSDGSKRDEQLQDSGQLSE